MTPVFTNLPGGALAAYWFGDPHASPDVVFLHGNSFNALTYAPLLKTAADRGLNVLAFDMRGYGRTTLHADPRAFSSWKPLAQDIARGLEAFGTGDALFCGHSMGAGVCALLADLHPERVAGILMLEPVILPRAIYATAGFAPGRALVRNTLPPAKKALRRRAVFPSRDDARAAWSGKNMFDGWQPAFFEAYLEHGLNDNPDGTVGLACDPKWEANAFSAQAHDLWGALKRFDGPLRILAGGRGSTLPGSSEKRLRSMRPDAHIEREPAYGHFLPMQAPARCAEAMVEEVARLRTDEGEGRHTGRFNPAA